jgi:hypothetical protein
VRHRRVRSLQGLPAAVDLFSLSGSTRTLVAAAIAIVPAILRLRAHMLAGSDRAVAGVWYQAPATSGLRVEPVYQSTLTSVIRIYSID